MTNATSKFQVQQYLSNGGILANFMPASQRFFILEAIEGEEGGFFVEKVLEIVKIIRQSPVTYNTEDVETDEKVFHLHYFKGSIDAWIVERDVGDTTDQNGEGQQLQAFGKINLCGTGFEDAEWGYISIQDLIDNGVELDLHWTPKPAKEF